MAAARLDFEAPDVLRFPALRLAREAVEAGGTAPAALNAANEVAVAAFLAGNARFHRIPEVIEDVLQGHENAAASSLEAVLEADVLARAAAARALGAGAGVAG